MTDLSPHDLDRAISLAHQLADQACDLMRRRQTGPARTKSHPADHVTDTDERIERHVREALSRAFPDHRVEGEEFGVREGTGRDAPTWVVDPVDGTTNYAHGIGWSSFSLGLSDTAGPLLAVVADPWRDERYSAVRGRGALLNGGPTHASDAPGLSGHVVMTEWSAHAPWSGLSSFLSQLGARYCTVRMMGSTALSLCQVAAGRAAAGAIGAFHAEDGLPPLLIATEAGALAFDDLGPLTAPDLSPAGGLLLSAPRAAAEASGIWRRARAEGGVDLG